MKKRGVKRATEQTPSSPEGRRVVHRRSKDNLRKTKGLKKKYPKGCHPNTKKVWWKPGKSAHPEGRPRKEHTITSLIKAYLDTTEEKTGMTREAILAQVVVDAAIELNKTALKEVMGRADGAIKQHIEVEGIQQIDLSVGDLARELAKREKAKKKSKDWWKPKGRKARKRLEERLAKNGS